MRLRAMINSLDQRANQQTIEASRRLTMVRKQVAACLGRGSLIWMHRREQSLDLGSLHPSLRRLPSRRDDLLAGASSFPYGSSRGTPPKEKSKWHIPSMTRP